MVNYYFLEYFRELAGMSGRQLSELCGKHKASNQNYYSQACHQHNELPDECINSIADALGISVGWITQSPVLFSKKNLDDYIEQHTRECDTPLVEKTDRPNQYIIVSQVSAGYLMDFAEKKREFGKKFGSITPAPVAGHALDQFVDLLKVSFLDDPDYVKMPLRPLLNYASMHYESVPSFARAFASQCPPEVLSKSGTEAFIRKLMMAPTIPSTNVEKRVMEGFASFANITMDEAYCDFRISSHESVFNLFLAASIVLSGWSIYEDDKGVTLTLTNPKYLPSAKTTGVSSDAVAFPPGFQL